MEHLVVDSNVLVASLLESEEFHLRGQQYISGLENADYTFHLPMLVVVEVAASIVRRPQRNRQAILLAWQQNVDDWERDGKILLYPLDRDRMSYSISIAEQHRLKGADSVVAAPAYELDMPLKTFDREVLARFLRASV